MTRMEFVDALYRAGWDSPCDAQWDKITKLYKEWFPKDALIEELNEEIFNLELEKYK